MEFSEDIKELIQTRLGGKDIYSMSVQELEKFKEQVTELRQEYSLLELALKLCGNGAYGASASPFFYFFNVELAGDITGECRQLTKTMWDKLEHFFHEDIWERKDLWKEFGFELDESKHDWYRQQPISIYSDTDSLAENSELIIRRNGKLLKRNFLELWREVVYQHIPFGLGEGHQEICQCDDEILNWTKEKGLHFVPINYIMKHRVSKARYSVKSKSGKEVIVTGDHSCIVFRNEEQLSIKASEILLSDKILTISSHKDYIFEEIESIEQLDDFDNECVYDIEVNDDSHTFIGNDILVHNSVYTTYGTFFQCWTPESLSQFNNDLDKVRWILDFNKRLIDKQNNKWCEEMYNPRHGKNVHEFELETISRALIGLKKKKYIKGYSFVKGKFYENPKMAGTGIEIIKSTTPKLCREILTELTRDLMFNAGTMSKDEYVYYFREQMQMYKKQFYAAPIEDISQSVNIGAYKKFIINDQDVFECAKGTPLSVKAIGLFNHLAHVNGQDNKRTVSGKIKYYNIKIDPNNPKSQSTYFGFPAGELPDWAPRMDKKTQWQKTVVDPINRFLEVMKIPLMNADNTIQMDLFGFGDEQTINEETEDVNLNLI